MAGTERARLGDILCEAGLVDAETLRSARAEQARTGRRLGETLVRSGAVREADLVRTLARRLGVPGAHLEGKAIDPEVLGLLPADVALRLACLPLFTRSEQAGEVLFLGMEDPGDLAAVEEVGRRTGCEVRPVLVGPVSLRRSLAEGYGGASGPEAGAPEPEGEGASADGPPSGRPARADADTAPILPGEERAEDAGGDAEEGIATADGERPREVPTRDILRALTRLLIEKEVIGRAELLRAVDQVRAEARGRGRDGGDAPGSA